MPEYVPVEVSAGVTKNIGAREDGTTYYQEMVPFSRGRSDIYTTTPTSGTVVDVNKVPCNRFAIQVVGVGGTPTVWTVILEGSLEGTLFTEIGQHNNTNDTINKMRWFSAPTAVKYFRSRISALTLSGATNVTVYIVGEAGL